MIINHIKQTNKAKIKYDLVKDISMQVLVGEKEGWKDHVMRVFTVEKGGHTPHHKHPWPHINYVLEGQGTLQIEDDIHPLSKGSYAYVDANTVHQFKNTSNDPLKFICIVPKEGHQ
ncbi:MAG: cupin domain-containing protein [Candidatus Izimaplasma sp.]|nr:cupin domain-containing protein [Candidatus Izimaplasma bacterium]